MAEIFKFFNSAPGDERWHYASDFADYFGSVLSSGLISNGDSPVGLQVNVNAGTMTTNVSVGKALIKGYSYENTTLLTLTHSIPEQTLDRIDRIVLRLDLKNASRFIKVFVKEGVSALEPVPPILQRDQYIYELSLAQVRIRKNTSSIVVSDIKDERADESLCGIVQSLITVPTSVFQQQFDTWFTSITDGTEQSVADWQIAQQQAFTMWFESIKGQLDGDVGVKLASELTTHKADEAAHGIGNKATLKTTDKTTIVGAVNELFTDVDNGKTQIANAIVGKNGTASSSDTFTQLASAISLLGGGVKSVQRGYLNEQLSSVLSKNITISAVNPDNTIVLIDNYGGTSNAFSRVFKTIELVNDVTIKIESGEYYAALYDNWQVLEFDKLKSKQSGVVQLNQLETSKDISLKKVDLSKIGVFFSWTTNSSRTSTGSNDSIASHMPRLVVANDSTLTISRQKLYTPVGTITLRWQVVEFE